MCFGTQIFWQERRSEIGRERPTGCCTHAATGCINVVISYTSLALSIHYCFGVKLLFIENPVYVESTTNVSKNVSSGKFSGNIPD